MKIIKAVSGVPIRLTPERMSHIGSRHPEMRDEADRIIETISMPDLVQEGDSGTLIALKHYARTPLSEKFCAVVYRETDIGDGFVLTAYFTRQSANWRRIAWKQ
ncbi:MAG: hypothetical protein KKH28_07430 [Elusimicrobia bacterium]|nr:hypothetical protein [Elusimicrobiota bacterium]